MIWRWGVKAVAGLGANLALLALWVEVVGIHPAIAVLINWVLISLAGYAITEKWVFRQREATDSHVRRYLGLQGVMLGSKAVNYVIYIGLLAAGVPYLLAWVLGAGMSFVLSYSGARSLWTRSI